MNNQTVLSLIYNAVLDQLFTVSTKSDVTMNDENISPTKRAQQCNKAIVSFVRGHGTFGGDNIQSKTEAYESIIMGKF